MIPLCSWFDGTSANPCSKSGDGPGTVKALWESIYKEIRSVSPNTMITSYRGDVCAAKDGQTLYTNNGPPPNSTDPSSCMPNLGKLYIQCCSSSIARAVACRICLISPVASNWTGQVLPPNRGAWHHDAGGSRWQHRRDADQLV
jgi:hypothetical protein